MARTSNAKAPGVRGRAKPPYFIGATEAAEILGCSRSKAYKVLKRLTEECEEKGMILPDLMPGHCPRKYFMKRCMIE